MKRTTLDSVLRGQKHLTLVFFHQIKLAYRMIIQ